MRAVLLLLTSFFVLSNIVIASSSPEPQLMPMPSAIKVSQGSLRVDKNFSVAATGAEDARITRGVDRFLEHLRRQTGMLPLNFHVAKDTAATLVVHVDKASKDLQELGEDESYSLEITPTSAKLNAATTLGALHGLQTFLQLVSQSADGFMAPAVSIQDSPRFPWRGLMIDCGRHFIPIEVLKRNLDGMEAVKLNVFHWHLSEDQGFRIESKKYPKLHEMGSDGLFYTQDEVRDVIAYARDRGIRVVPEFDMPGHTTSWFVGYPEYASAAGPFQIERKWGVFDPAMDPTNEELYKFLDGFIGEMAKIFPDHYFHIGGDEVNGKQWNANSKIQSFMKEHSLATDADLQAYFNVKVQKIVDKHGKIMEGWDEILRPDLPKNIVIQSWRGQKSLAEATQQGYSGLLSNGYYLDLMESAARHYSVDPMSGADASLNDEQKKHILGGEACMWDEYISPEIIDSRIWPRTAAIAERFWSPQSTTDIDSMYRRMAFTSQRLDWLGLTHNSYYPLMLRRIAGGEDSPDLRTLADASAGLHGWYREEYQGDKPTASMPLNRLADAVHPESEAARQFGILVDQLVAHKSDPQSNAQIRAWLIKWRDQRGGFDALATRSLLAQELVPASQRLATAATIGLQALDYIEHNQQPPSEWKSSSYASLESALKPVAQINLSAVPQITKLAYFASGETPPPPKQRKD